MAAACASPTATMARAGAISTPCVDISKREARRKKREGGLASVPFVAASVPREPFQIFRVKPRQVRQLSPASSLLQTTPFRAWRVPRDWLRRLAEGKCPPAEGRQVGT